MEHSIEILCAVRARGFIKDAYGPNASLRDHSYEFVDLFNEYLAAEDAKPKKSKKTVEHETAETIV